MTATTPPYQPHHGPAPMATAKSKQRWLIPVIVGAVVLFLCCVGGIVIAAVSSDPSDPESAAQSPREGRDQDRSPARSGDDAPTEPEPAKEPEEEPARDPEPTGFGAGVWEVGAEIPPGTYVTVVPEGAFNSCYWARLSGFSGGFDDIIANDNLESGARGRVTIAESDTGIEFTGACRWVEESEAEPVKVGDEIGAGVWRVGEEVEPGTYVTTASDGTFGGCYWARLSGFSGDFDDIIANDLVEAGARGRVEISGSDAGIEFTGDCLWTRN